MPTKQAIIEALEKCLILGEEEYRKLPRDGRIFKNAISHLIEYRGRRLNMRPIWYDACEACGEDKKRQRSGKTFTELRNMGFIVKNEISPEKDIYITDQKLFQKNKYGYEKYVTAERKFWVRCQNVSNEAKRLKRYTCEACDFNFKKFYGSESANYIETHHIEPLSFSELEAKETSINDLLVLCANCHAAIHRMISHHRRAVPLTELKANFVGKSK